MTLPVSLPVLNSALGAVQPSRTPIVQNKDGQGQVRDDERNRHSAAPPPVDLVKFQRDAEARYNDKVQVLSPAADVQDLPYEARRAVALYEQNQYARTPDDDGLERGIDIFV